MCGITGIWHFSGAPLAEHKLKVFTDSLAHRGPDGFGYHIDNSSNFGMGHRRLSILDLTEGGKQPMSFAEDRYWITYNGEVFNFLELRTELKSKGYTFKTESDTEVILSAYHCWGSEALQKFNGMWAMAIWDSVERKLFLARDRFGIKPLYFTHVPGTVFAFASETYAFKFLKDYERSFSKKNIELQMKDPDTLEGLGYTIFENIFQLLPGHYMVIEEDKVSPQKRWWNTLDNLQQVPASYTDQVEKFRELLVSSTQLRLRSDVPVATALSGGVDSSSVFCTLDHMMKHTKNKERMPSDWQQAFVATFPGTQSDERVYAEKVIGHAKLKGTYIVLDDSNLTERIIATTVKSDSILGSPIISQYMVYEAMRKNGVSVSMDGHGVDEMLYGYPWLVKAAYKYYDGIEDVENRQDMERTYTDLFPDDSKEAARAKLMAELGTGSSLHGIKKKLKNTRLHKVYSSLNRNHNGPLPSLSNAPYFPKQLNSADQILFHCFHTSTLPTLLRNFDRASMLNSVEVRMPFMDWRLVSYVFSLPLTSKIGGGYTKRILRDAMKGIVPDSILQRKQKVGLMAPMYDWFNSKMGQMILDEVNSDSFKRSGFWDGASLATLATERTRSKTWNAKDCAEFWTVLNMHLLEKNNK